MCIWGLKRGAVSMWSGPQALTFSPRCFSSYFGFWSSVLHVQRENWAVDNCGDRNTDDVFSAWQADFFFSTVNIYYLSDKIAKIRKRDPGNPPELGMSWLRLIWASFLVQMAESSFPPYSFFGSQFFLLCYFAYLCPFPVMKIAWHVADWAELSKRKVGPPPFGWIILTSWQFGAPVGRGADIAWETRENQQ